MTDEALRSPALSHPKSEHHQLKFLVAPLVLSTLSSFLKVLVLRQILGHEANNFGSGLETKKLIFRVKSLIKTKTFSKFYEDHLRTLSCKFANRQALRIS
jgi:hypothetical protein